MSDNKPAIQEATEVVAEQAKKTTRQNPKGSYEGRKHEPEIDGVMPDSQETDEVYVDPRKVENLPPAGKNVGELNAYDLSKEGNQPDI